MLKIKLLFSEVVGLNYKKQCVAGFLLLVLQVVAVAVPVISTLNFPNVLIYITVQDIQYFTKNRLEKNPKN